MKLLVPASFKQLNNRIRWFKKPIARKLTQEKNVGFGFELKGEPEEIKTAPPLFWGYHLPDYFATEWYYHPEKHQELLSRISHFTSLRPDYVNLHGVHLWWQPPSREYIHRYANHSEPEEYLKVLNANAVLIKKLQKLLPKVRLTLENYPLYQYYTKNGRQLPETYLYTGTGRLNDLIYLRQKTGVELLLDLEHLILTLNFLNRKRNYRDIPRKKIEKLSPAERKLQQIFGFYLKKDVIPYVDEPVELAEIVQKIRAKYYHLTGSVQDVIPGKKILTHEPIEVNDKVFRKNLRLVLAQKPEVILIEVASSADNPCWHYLRPNETELSFYQMCEILLEEL